tara:strand:+ start:13059 stop:16721 length:3663 start_codon:yes stop_codon:yes gene_type:complete
MVLVLIILFIILLILGIRRSFQSESYEVNWEVKNWFYHVSSKEKCKDCKTWRQDRRPLFTIRWKNEEGVENIKKWIIIFKDDKNKKIYEIENNEPKNLKKGKIVTITVPHISEFAEYVDKDIMVKVYYDEVKYVNNTYNTKFRITSEHINNVNIRHGHKFPSTEIKKEEAELVDCKGAWKKTGDRKRDDRYSYQDWKYQHSVAKKGEGKDCRIDNSKNITVKWVTDKILPIFTRDPNTVKKLETEPDYHSKMADTFDDYTPPAPPPPPPPIYPDSHYMLKGGHWYIIGNYKNRLRVTQDYRLFFDDSFKTNAKSIPACASYFYIQMVKPEGDDKDQDLGPRFWLKNRYTKRWGRVTRPTKYDADTRVHFDLIDSPDKCWVNDASIFQLKDGYLYADGKVLRNGQEPPSHTSNTNQVTYKQPRNNDLYKELHGLSVIRQDTAEKGVVKCIFPGETKERPDPSKDKGDKEMCVWEDSSSSVGGKEVVDTRSCKPQFTQEQWFRKIPDKYRKQEYEEGVQKTTGTYEHEKYGTTKTEVRPIPQKLPIYYGSDVPTNAAAMQKGFNNAVYGINESCKNLKPGSECDNYEYKGDDGKNKYGGYTFSTISYLLGFHYYQWGYLNKNSINPAWHYKKNNDQSAIKPCKTHDPEKLKKDKLKALGVEEGNDNIIIPVDGMNRLTEVIPVFKSTKPNTASMFGYASMPNSPTKMQSETVSDRKGNEVRHIPPGFGDSIASFLGGMVVGDRAANCVHVYKTINLEESKKYTSNKRLVQTLNPPREITVSGNKVTGLHNFGSCVASFNNEIAVTCSDSKNKNYVLIYELDTSVLAAAVEGKRADAFTYKYPLEPIIDNDCQYVIKGKTKDLGDNRKEIPYYKDCDKNLIDLINRNNFGISIQYISNNRLAVGQGPSFWMDGLTLRVADERVIIFKKVPQKVADGWEVAWKYETEIKNPDPYTVKKDGALSYEIPLGFGTSIAGGWNTLMIGSWESDKRKGAVHVYDFVDNKFKHKHKIVRSDGRKNDYFGMDIVYIDQHKTLIVSAPGSGYTVGKVYIYKKSDNGWDEKQVLQGKYKSYEYSPGSSLPSQEFFGYSMASHNDNKYLLIGAPGGRVTYKVVSGDSDKTAIIETFKDGRSSLEHVPYEETKGDIREGFVYMYKRQSDGTYKYHMIIHRGSTSDYIPETSAAFGSQVKSDGRHNIIASSYPISESKKFIEPQVYSASTERPRHV